MGIKLEFQEPPLSTVWNPFRIRGCYINSLREDTRLNIVKLFFELIFLTIHPLRFIFPLLTWLNIYDGNCKTKLSQV